MRIAFLHFHLKKGGVTTVIREQAAVASGRHDLLALCGSPDPGEFPCRVITVPGLEYDAEWTRNHSPARIAEAVLDAIHGYWPSGCDILHVHNPTLAKNRHLIPALKILKKRGIRLLLQIHDFAEDGRPAFFTKEEYPQNCHYCVINSRDRRLLIDSGLREEGVHLVHNRIKDLDSRGSLPLLEEHVLYPVRAIRRKNLGEALLLSLFFNPGRRLVVTLPPNSETDKRVYDFWRSFSDRAHLDVEFEAGLKHDFKDLVLRASSVLTTSITEGFGFAFLEPLTAGKRVWGRRISHVCNDFEKNGINLANLYPEIKIPLSEIDPESFFSTMIETYRQARTLYGLVPDDTPARRFAGRCFKRGWIDFGLLDEKRQMRIIESLISNPEKKELLIGLNPFLGGLPERPLEKEKMDKNIKAISTSYGYEAFSSRLFSVYEKVLNCEVSQKIDKRRLAEAFLAPEEFSLLKWRQPDI